MWSLKITLPRQAEIVFGRGGVWLLLAGHGKQGLGTEGGLTVILDHFHLNTAGNKRWSHYHVYVLKHQSLSCKWSLIIFHLLAHGHAQQHALPHFCHSAASFCFPSGCPLKEWTRGWTCAAPAACCFLSPAWSFVGRESKSSYFFSYSYQHSGCRYMLGVIRVVFTSSPVVVRKCRLAQLSNNFTDENSKLQFTEKKWKV